MQIYTKIEEKGLINSIDDFIENSGLINSTIATDIQDIEISDEILKEDKTKNLSLFKYLYNALIWFDSNKKISNFLEKKSVFKHIIVKNKLVNLIVKWNF